jgi:hypothetical protein
MDLAIAIIGAVAAAAAAVAAFGSWSAARTSNASTASMVAVERDRRHDELTPEFEITCTMRATAPDSADLRVALTGGRLERLDSVTVTILDEAGQDHWGRGLPHGVSQEDAEAFVWGPWEFNTGASKQVVSNRESRPRAYSRVSGKNWDLRSMTHTRPGLWMSGMSQEDWRRQRKGQPVRLLLTCHWDGYEPWFIQHDVKVEQGGGPAIRVIGT